MDAALLSAAFKSDGKQVALTFEIRRAQSSRLVVWNVSDDKVEWDTPLPFIPRQLVWAGDDLLFASLFSRQAFGAPYRPNMQQDPNGPNYQRQFPDASDVWRPENAETMIRVSPAEKRFVWQYRGGPIPNPTYPQWYPGTFWQLAGQTAGDRAWLSHRDAAGRHILRSIADRTSEENETIKKHTSAKRDKISGEAVSLAVEVGTLPEIIARSTQRREEFRTDIENDLKKRLAKHQLMAPEGLSLKLKATMEQRRASDMLAALQKQHPYGHGAPQIHQISPYGVDALGVMARLELKDADEPDSDDPLWLTEAWFAEWPRTTAPGDISSAVRVLITWERAVEWITKQRLPDSLMDANQFRPIGTTQLSVEKEDS
jgi:hypothetical protein